MISVSQTTSLTTATSPPSPTIVPSLPGEVNTHSVIVRWLAPSKLPDNVNSVTYQLVKDGSLLEASISEEFFLVENLSSNTTYEFRVKVCDILSLLELTLFLCLGDD